MQRNDLLHVVRILQQLSADILLEHIRYNKEGGCDVEAVEQRVRSIGQDLKEQAEKLEKWHG